LVWFLGPVSIVASRWGVLCQVLKRFIASVDRGFVGFGVFGGLDKVCGLARTAGGFVWSGVGCVGGAEEGRSVVAPFGLHSGPTTEWSPSITQEAAR